ncbi:MAG: universal stress protein [Campylobacterales bacterium]|nr:universal stress protein [Campylobacterales bacterium]
MKEENNTILACIDATQQSSVVSDYAIWMAQRISRPLHFINTIEHHSKTPQSNLSGNIGLGARDDLLESLAGEEEQQSRELLAKGKTSLQHAKEQAEVAGVKATASQRHGMLYENLAELEKEIRVLVLGRSGESLKSPVGGQVEEVIRLLHKPILLVGKAFSAPKSIMLAYDGTPSSNKALEMVATSRLFQTLDCHVVNVNDSSAVSQKLLDKAKELLEKSAIAASYTSLQGEAVSRLSSYLNENNIDIMVMGAFSHNRLRDALFGSFTAKLISGTDKPLLLLR